MSNESPEEVGSASAGNTCPLCGGDLFTWGVARGHIAPRFKPDKSGWLAKNTIFGGQKIRARRCEMCGNIQLFAVK